MMVTSSFDLIIHGTDDSVINIIIYKKYILFKANLKQNMWTVLGTGFILSSVDVLGTLLQSYHKVAILILSNLDTFFPTTMNSTGMKFGTHVVEGSLNLLALIYSDSLAKQHFKFNRVHNKNSI
jgi:hypothetical protein